MLFFIVFCSRRLFWKWGKWKNVSLYLLEPKKFNALCKKRVDKNVDDKKEDRIDRLYAVNDNVLRKQEWTIPNFSVLSNEKIFEAYLLGNPESEHKVVVLLLSICIHCLTYNNKKLELRMMHLTIFR